MMAVRQNRALMLPFVTLHLAWLFPHASFGSPVMCWWHTVSSASHNVSIECQADPQGSMLNCDLCHMHVRPLKPAAHVSQTGCSHRNVSFRALLDEHEMQTTNCTLLCPGHTPLPCNLKKGYPPPYCLIPFYDEGNNMHCHWRGLFNPLIPTNFTLHWKMEVKDGQIHSKDFGENKSGIIERYLYETHEIIKVWVTAANRLGTVDSEMLITNTKSFIQPATPSISKHSSEPLEITWDVSDDTEQFDQCQCKVQYKKLCDKDWTEAEDTYEVSFILEDAVPFTTYKFRVRCQRVSDEKSVMSDWSSEYTVETPAAAPIGTLDVWSDCDSTSYDTGCSVFWKEMPMQQARGKINNYVVTMKLTNGSVLNLNGSFYTPAETCVHCGLDNVEKEQSNRVSHAQQNYMRCPQEQERSCFYYFHLSIPVKEVNIIEVTANTTGGKSNPALVALPKTGLLQPVALEVRGRSKELNISWSVPQFSVSVQEYVVQHIAIGLPNTPCVNWMKVKKNQTFVTLRGQLTNYTAYNVSLFAVVNNRSCLLQSAIAYSVEGVPSEVTDFQAIPTSPYSVNLTWTPIPLNKSHGYIIQYFVGLLDNEVQGCATASGPQQVHNVSSNKRSFQISKLNPGQQYAVWISTKTSAGEGKRTTACFTTPSVDLTNLMFLIIIVLVVMTVVISTLICIVWRCLRTKVTEWFYKIPDPINSSSFKQMSNQVKFWHSLPVRSASMECGLAISQVEIVLKPKVDPEPEEEQALEEEQELEEEHREQGQGREKELQRYDGVEQNNLMPSHQKEYSQMIDSSDEDDGEDWYEQPFPSDYEKHFLPCIVEA